MNSILKEENISDIIKENLNEMGFTELTPIQKKTIPIVLSGKDLIGQSKTGSGKTAAFLIPIIQSIETNGKVQAIILTPTRELAMQIRDECVKISNNTKIKSFTVYGGKTKTSVQISLLEKVMPEIIIGTPGRVLENLEIGALSFKNLKFFVLDEVDEMLKKGFIEPIKSIADFNKKNLEKTQILFFSATVSRETEELANIFLKNPVNINNIENNTNSKSLITQNYVPIEGRGGKMSTLIDLIYFQDPELAIIFASTKKTVDRINNEISKEFSCDKIHSDLTQSKREEVYEKFKNRKIRFLIATDIAARGIDIKDISHVYNYDFPQDSEFYIHRIGRTGRAGSSGQSVILLEKWETRSKVPFLEKLTGDKIQVIYPPSPDLINEIIENKSVEKITDLIESQKEKEVSEKIINLKNIYTSEQIIKGLSKFFTTKRRIIKKDLDENKFIGRKNRNFERSSGYDRWDKRKRTNDRTNDRFKRDSFSYKRKFR